MVIMWENDGQVILSQRRAPGEVMPTVDSNPPRIATFAQSASSLSGDNSKFAFTIPANSDTTQPLIYAYGTDAPGSSAVDATLHQHSDYGTLVLNLEGPNSSGNLPLLTYERLIIAHASFMVAGFLLLLPAGALVARYLRTFTPTWFKSHWIIQFLIWAIIHFVKSTTRVRRPPQNYLHAVLGLVIIGLAIAQIQNGYSDEWKKTTGRNTLPNSVSIIFYVWIGVIVAAYFGGLALLPKQFRQEHQPKRIPVGHRDS
ncbi:hypothetical protein H0H81_007748 [Sphagnurus paluster]|uniref:Cytochrome b561 domain-containing protein n=1 Tax=Sphagnurus paluster TaxID=117069 RepID=A0A9P7FX97_9AGAR|nr:hypothetical protein H0H81_007748 [Sphagnurus paluster]